MASNPWGGASQSYWGSGGPEGQAGWNQAWGKYGTWKTPGQYGGQSQAWDQIARQKMGNAQNQWMQGYDQSQMLNAMMGGFGSGFGGGGFNFGSGSGGQLPQFQEDDVYGGMMGKGQGTFADYMTQSGMDMDALFATGDIESMLGKANISGIEVGDPAAQAAMMMQPQEQAYASAMNNLRNSGAVNRSGGSVAAGMMGADLGAARGQAFGQASAQTQGLAKDRAMANLGARMNLQQMLSGILGDRAATQAAMMGGWNQTSMAALSAAAQYKGEQQKMMMGMMPQYNIGMSQNNFGKWTPSIDISGYGGWG